MPLTDHLSSLASRGADFFHHLARFPWKDAVLTLRERLREDRLGLSAGSLTFTTLIALVPLFTVVLAIFTAFPMFATLQVGLQKWLVASLVPDNISRQVLGYLTQFSGKASRLGVAGLAVLFMTALTLVFTIDRTLNGIWRVQRPRPWGQRLLIYWAALTLGPLLLAGSLAITSYIVSASRGLVGAMPGGMRVLLDGLEMAMVAGGLAALYHHVPHTRVRWSHAWVGGALAAGSIELAKSLLGVYLKLVPTYSAVYGAFATVPILLVWIYVAWLIVLLGAVVTAYLPSLLSGTLRRGNSPGWEFVLALDALAELLRSHHASARGRTLEQLSDALRVDPVQLQAVLGTLVALDWVGRLDETGGRYMLLVDPRHTSVGPLADRLLLAPSPRTARMSLNGRSSTSLLSEVL